MGIVIRHATADDVRSLLGVEGESYPEPWDDETFRTFLAQPSTICVLVGCPSRASQASIAGDCDPSESPTNNLSAGTTTPMPSTSSTASA